MRNRMIPAAVAAPWDVPLSHLECWALFNSLLSWSSSSWCVPLLALPKLHHRNQWKTGVVNSRVVKLNSCKTLLAQPAMEPLSSLYLLVSSSSFQLFFQAFCILDTSAKSLRIDFRSLDGHTSSWSLFPPLDWFLTFTNKDGSELFSQAFGLVSTTTSTKLSKDTLPTNLLVERFKSRRYYI